MESIKGEIYIMVALSHKVFHLNVFPIPLKDIIINDDPKKELVSAQDIFSKLTRVKQDLITKMEIFVRDIKKLFDQPTISKKTRQLLRNLTYGEFAKSLDILLIIDDEIFDNIRTGIQRSMDISPNIKSFIKYHRILDTIYKEIDLAFVACNLAIKAINSIIPL
jgi:hypothetical protein